MARIDKFVGKHINMPLDIIKKRKGLRLMQADMVKMMGCSIYVITSIERGDLMGISLGHIKAYLNILGYDISIVQHLKTDGLPRRKGKSNTRLMDEAFNVPRVRRSKPESSSGKPHDDSLFDE